VSDSARAIVIVVASTDSAAANFLPSGYMSGVAVPSGAIVIAVAMGESIGRARVMIVDDKSKIRSMLAEQIGGAEDCEVIGEAATGQEAVELARRMLPSVILMDIEMPIMDGIAATRIIASEHPEIRILILTYLVNRDFVSAAMACGACGYIVRGADTAMIVNDIRSAYSGRLVIAPEFNALGRAKFANLDSALSHDDGVVDDAFAAQLTSRETEILNLIGTGLQNTDILKRLSIRPSTLEHHIEHIFEKIGVHSRAQAVVWVRQHGLGVVIPSKGDNG